MSAQNIPDSHQRPLRLGVNIDHVATLRNARGGEHPDPLRAAQIAQDAQADGLTIHLREDRRHIRDHDVAILSERIDLPLNLEMAVTDEMLEIARQTRPHACCLVPEKREELTTEGGLDVVKIKDILPDFIAALHEAQIRVSLFIDAEDAQIETAKLVGADIIELHTGRYCEAMLESDQVTMQKELERLQNGARQADAIGLEVHAGHGLDFSSVGAVAAIPQIVELNIGHFLVGEAVFMGLGAAIAHMKALMLAAREHKTA